jgi:hypothetical protein
MPFVIHAYHFAPQVARWFELGDVLWTARAMFATSFAAGSVLLGCLIKRGGPRLENASQKARDWHGFAGDAVAATGCTAALFGLIALDQPLLDQANRVMSWKLLTGVAQGVMVAGWCLLWHVRRRWLSRWAAGIAAIAALVGFGLYVVSNLLLQDPITEAWGWGIVHPQSIVARLTGWVWLEPLLAGGMVSALLLLLGHFWRRQRDRERHGPAAGQCG